VELAQLHGVLRQRVIERLGNARDCWDSAFGVVTAWVKVVCVCAESSSPARVIGTGRTACRTSTTIARERLSRGRQRNRASATGFVWSDFSRGGQRAERGRRRADPSRHAATTRGATITPSAASSTTPFENSVRVERWPPPRGRSSRRFAARVRYDCAADRRHESGDALHRSGGTRSRTQYGGGHGQQGVEAPNSLGVVRCAQSTRFAGEVVRRAHTQPDAAVGVELVDGRALTAADGFGQAPTSCR